MYFTYNIFQDHGTHSMRRESCIFPAETLYEQRESVPQTSSASP